MILKTFAGTNQAAGSEVSEVVPAGQSWRLLAVQVVLVTSATAANRFPQLQLDDGTTAFVQLPGSSAALTATTTTTLTWAFGTGPAAGPFGAAASQVAYGPILSAILGAGYHIKTLTNGLQAGDDYAAPILFFGQLSQADEWLVAT